MGFCAGTTFIYPKVVEAKAMGLCKDNLQIITGGFDNDPNLMADCGDDKTIVRLTISGVESIIWPMAMLDAALCGTMYPDYPGIERLDSSVFVINTSEKFDAIVNHSPMGVDLDVTKALLDWEGMKDLFISVNPDATYAKLTEVCKSFQVEDYLK